MTHKVQKKKKRETNKVKGCCRRRLNKHKKRKVRLGEEIMMIMIYSQICPIS